MKISDMKRFFDEVSLYLGWEKFQECMINSTDSYEVCVDKVNTVLYRFSQQDSRGWEYFKAIYEDIPVQFKMPLMLEVVYQYYRVDYPEMLNYISDYIWKEETPELKEQRIARNKAALGRRVRKDGFVKLYRGIAENFLMEEYAVSYTLDKKIADFFVEHHKLRHRSRFGTVICSLVNIKDILCYTNERKEREVCIIPCVVHEREYYYPIESWDDMLYVDEENIIEIVSYKEYETIMEELEKQEA